MILQQENWAQWAVAKPSRTRCSRALKLVRLADERDANFIVLPLFFSSALFPVLDLPGAVRLAVRVNPLSHGVNGLRGALSGGGFVFGVATDFAVLGSLAAILLAIGAYLFSKIEHSDRTFYPESHFPPFRAVGALRLPR